MKFSLDPIEWFGLIVLLIAVAFVVFACGRFFHINPLLLVATADELRGKWIALYW